MAKWIIDAGHGGKDSGGIGFGGRREKNIALDAALEAKRVLELNGEEVFLIRSNDIYMELKDRITYTNNWGGDFYIGIHMNYSDSDSIEGTEVMIRNCDDSSGRELGDYLLGKLVKGLKSNNNGIYEIDYGILSGIKIPGVICLGNYISNRQVERNFNGEHYGRIIGNGCVQFVGKIPKGEGLKNKGINKEKSKDYGWRVCVGVYEDFAEAKKVVQDIKARGVSNVYIIPYLGKK